jgi:hypothetical protein
MPKVRDEAEPRGSAAQRDRLPVGQNVLPRALLFGRCEEKLAAEIQCLSHLADKQTLNIWVEQEHRTNCHKGINGLLQER